MSAGIGATVRRKEDLRLVTGRGHYSDDFNLPGQAYGAAVRSPHAHALIRSIDAAAARAMPGVLAVLTGEDALADGLKRIPHLAAAGTRPVGWMTGRPGPNTRRLLVEAGGFLYDRDSLADELPYWLQIADRPHLVIPYSYEANDNRFNENSGFSTADHFFTYLRDAFDVLYREGKDGAPKLLSIGLHDRLIGRPGRCQGLIKILEYMRGFDRVWFCTGAEIAQHWCQEFPAVGGAGAMRTPEK